jgi:hypothetical protein
MFKDKYNGEESITSVLTLNVSQLNGSTTASIRPARCQDWYIFPHRQRRKLMTLFRLKALNLGFRENNPVGLRDV